MAACKKEEKREKRAYFRDPPRLLGARHACLALAVLRQEAARKAGTPPPRDHAAKSRASSRVVVEKEGQRKQGMHDNAYT